ncbi:MAG: glycosyltransferase [Verrucomicrobiota bacterium]
MQWLIWILAALAALSLGIALWQFLGALRFPLHQRIADPAFAPGLSLLKPLKGCDTETARCLRSWLAQAYPGQVQVLFGVANAADPVCSVVKQLLAEFPTKDAHLVICEEVMGVNAKVSTLIQLERRVRYDTVLVSDADVVVPEDFLANVVAPLRDAKVGLVNCFYQLGNPVNLAMQWEAVAINADFWSQVLQSRNLKPLDFALGAVMLARRDALTKMGGFAALADYLADDYQLGHQIAGQGWRIELCPQVVECRESPMSAGQVWRHQLRWSRTIRVCQPVPYFFSILSNATVWPVLLALAGQAPPYYAALGICLTVRMLTATILQWRLTRASRHVPCFWLAPIKDLLQAAIWALSFLGNTIEWRGHRYRVLPGGKLTPE